MQRDFGFRAEASRSFGRIAEPVHRQEGDLGLVHREISPAEHRFSVNRRHDLVTQGLEGLFAAERRAVDEVFDRLTECSRLTQETAARIRAAWLFGSTARDVLGEPA